MKLCWHQSSSSWWKAFFNSALKKEEKGTWNHKTCFTSTIHNNLCRCRLLCARVWDQQDEAKEMFRWRNCCCRFHTLHIRCLLSLPACLESRCVCRMCAIVATWRELTYIICTFTSKKLTQKALHTKMFKCVDSYQYFILLFICVLIKCILFHVYETFYFSFTWAFSLHDSEK